MQRDGIVSSGRTALLHEEKHGLGILGGRIGDVAAQRERRRTGGLQGRGEWWGAIRFSESCSIGKGKGGDSKVGKVAGQVRTLSSFSRAHFIRTNFCFRIDLFCRCLRKLPT